MVEAQPQLDQVLEQNKHRTSDPPGTLEKNGYIVGETIGQGTYACVKKAFWTKQKAAVAIKIMSRAHSPPMFLKKYVPRELEVIRKLHHENIIQFYEIIETNMRIYIIMQYAENGTLLDLTRTKRTLAESRVRRYYWQLLDAIQYLHSCGIAHRDIKLENVALDAKDRIKLIDFGFACRVRDEGSDRFVEPQQSQTFCGSLSYASPEILFFKPYDPIPADIWAAGVVLYTLLYGLLPFSNNKNVQEILKNIAKGVQFPSTVPVTDHVKLLMGQIFVPVGRRITGVFIQQSLWFQIELNCEE